MPLTTDIRDNPAISSSRYRWRPVARSGLAAERRLGAFGFQNLPVRTPQLRTLRPIAR